MIEQGADKLLNGIAESERKMQIYMRVMTGGVISERDRVLQYTTGEFYQELSLFIEEGEIRKAELEKIKQNQKR